jgi:3-hydroxyisobutyrate dehydrogenase
MTTIGFIGLGHMGNPMARNLLKAGFNVHVYDVVPENVQALVKQGAVAAQSLAELAEQGDVIITSVQTGDQVREICFSHEGIFSHAKVDLLYIDCSSIDITTTRALHEEAHKFRICMLDAPVSGGVAGAEAATLTFMVGGDEADFQRAQSLLKVMGKKIVHAGPAGNGQAAKICNNLLLAISMIGVSEAFTLAKKLGLDPKHFFEISSNASGQCWSMTSYCPVPGILDNVPANNAYRPGFMAKMMLKDLRLGQHAAESVNAAIPLGAAATELYELFVNQGFGEMDFSGIINFIASSNSSK